MLKKTILFTIDHFSEKSIQGWIAAVYENNVNFCPILITINSYDYINIKNFNLREDVKKAGIGSGEFGFIINKNFVLGDNVSFYDKETLTLLWRGVIGKDIFLDTKKIEIEQDDVCHILNKEKCLQIISSTILSENITFLLYKINITIEKKPIYYLQTLHKKNDIKKDIFIENHVTTTNFIGTIDNYIFYEHFFIPLAQYKNVNAPDFIVTSIEASTKKYKIPIEIKKYEGQNIFLYSNNKNSIFRPNNILDIKYDKVIPLINQNNTDFQNEITIKKSIIFISNKNKIYWIPTHTQVNNTSFIAPNRRNIIYSNLELLNDKEIESTMFNLKDLLVYYKNFGTEKLIKMLYLYTLQRTGESEGIESAINFFEEIQKEFDTQTAIQRILLRFTTSDEYKKKNFFSQLKTNFPLT